MAIENVVLMEKVGQSPRSENQTQTEECFGFKWNKRDTYESSSMKEKTKSWLVERYFDNDPNGAEKLLAGENKVILDAGCGSGFTSLILFGEELKRHNYIGLDISDAANVARERFSEMNIPGEFLQCDISKDIFVEESCDIIYSEGVLHHTDNTKDSLLNLSRALKKGGKFLFYVYAKKAAIREFTDDFIRNAIADMGDEEAWKALEPLARLGKSLGDLNTQMTVEEDVPLLGIKKGEYDIQRFFYWFIAKAYYDPKYTIDEMNHINFDWYRPMNCHRHTPEEVRGWCEEAGLKIDHMDVQNAGITVVATKE